MPRRVIASLIVALAFLALTASLRAAAQGPAPGPGGPPPGARPQQPGGPGPGGPPPGMMPPPAAAPVDSFVAERDSLMKVVLAEIAGKENMAAESVFKEIRVLKGRPAGQLLRAMNMGFGRSLGTRCKHCHVVGHWEAEDKPEKQITRDMMAMTRTINDSLLMKIKNIRNEGDTRQPPSIGCATCHRGAVKPAQRM